MIKNITADVKLNWKQALKDKPKGLCIVRGIKESANVLRVGAGGNKGGEGGLYARFEWHMKPSISKPSVGTHEHLPYENIIAVWEVDWSALEISIGQLDRSNEAW